MRLLALLDQVADQLRVALTQLAHLHHLARVDLRGQLGIDLGGLVGRLRGLQQGRRAASSIAQAAGCGAGSTEAAAGSPRGGSSAAGGEGDARLELENEGAAVAKHAHVDVIAARRVEKGGARVEDGDRVAVDALLQGRRRAEGSGRGVGQRIGGGH